MIKEKLPIHKQYLVISSPVEFSLIANNGTDKVLRPAGVWQLDCYKLLPEKFMKNYPVFNLELEYDETKIPTGFTLEYYFTNINLGDSLKGVSGDLVELSEYQFETIKQMLYYTPYYPYGKIIDSVLVDDFVDDYGKNYETTVPFFRSKTLYIGGVVHFVDGTELILDPVVFFNSSDETENLK